MKQRDTARLGDLESRFSVAAAARVEARRARFRVWPYVYIVDVVGRAVNRTLVSDETRVRAELAACADEILLCRVDLVETHDAEALRRSALPVRGPDGRVEDKHLVLIW